ncbi:hypothetical protein RFI_31949 [Reticulomyxa filosa]|uniref:Uncharacterized protein n=1 Tax=Reticulomyxa filosa TaxID=46433 RepID=X6LXL0_RETFI|nr:hypothetical protein RFI_31949 [Reticulomyxa filosa]|eukprot:ETO05450.1 hypothetical protein RFI_31949 [Reticulomyxa filosa]
MKQSTLCFSVHCTYRIENLTEHRLWARVLSGLSSGLGSGSGSGPGSISGSGLVSTSVSGPGSIDSGHPFVTIVNPRSSESVFWSTDWIKSMQIALEGVDKDAMQYWSKVGSIGPCEHGKSYQVQMKGKDNYLTVCVVTVDVTEQCTVLSIRPKHILHNRMGRAVLLWPCGMVPQSNEAVPLTDLDSNAVVRVERDSFATLCHWRVRIDPTESRPVVSSAVRIKFESKRKLSLNNQEEKKEEKKKKKKKEEEEGEGEEWDWSNQLFIPSSMSRGRRHVIVKNTTKNFEDLISFVTILHRNVVHTVLFRCGQPPCLIRNDTDHTLNFCRTPNEEQKEEKWIFHQIAPRQSSAFDWRSDGNQWRDLFPSISTASSSSSSGHTQHMSESDITAKTVEEWADEEKIFEKNLVPVTLTLAWVDTSPPKAFHCVMGGPRSLCCKRKTTMTTLPTTCY